MDFEELVLWMVVMLPLITSPGPANIATASVSASRGFRAAMVFASAVTLVNCVILALMGAGMGLIYVKYATVFRLLEKLGALYIVYLGYRVFRSRPAAESADAAGLGFRDGLVLQALNTKLYPTLIMMFSQFLDGDRAAGAEVFELCAVTVVAMLLNYLMWAWIGTALGRGSGPITRWIQHQGFGSTLILVGLWLFFR